MGAISGDCFSLELAACVKKRYNYTACNGLHLGFNTASCGLLGSVWEAQLWSLAKSHHVHQRQRWTPSLVDFSEKGLVRQQRMKCGSITHSGL